MFNLIKAELYKLKRTYLILSVIFIPAMMPLMISKGNNKTLDDFVMASLAISVIIIFPLLINCIVSYIYGREFIDKNANQYFSYPVATIKLLFSKFIVCSILGLIMYLSAFIMVLLIGRVYFGSFITIDILKYHLGLLSKSWILNMFICPVSIMLTMWSRNIYLSFGYSIAMILFNFGSYTLFPIESIKYVITMIPSLDYFNLKFVEDNIFGLVGFNSILAVFLFFVAMMYICDKFYKKIDL